MATKTFCDACGKEGASNTFSYKCHLSAENRFMNGYVDGDGNHTSGREIYVDLCNKCYNEVVSTAVWKLEEIQNK